MRRGMKDSPSGREGGGRGLGTPGAEPGALPAVLCDHVLFLIVPPTTTGRELCRQTLRCPEVSCGGTGFVWGGPCVRHFSHTKWATRICPQPGQMADLEFLAHPPTGLGRPGGRPANTSRPRGGLPPNTSRPRGGLPPSRPPVRGGTRQLVWVARGVAAGAPSGGRSPATGGLWHGVGGGGSRGQAGRGGQGARGGPGDQLGGRAGVRVGRWWWIYICAGGHVGTEPGEWAGGPGPGPPPP